MRQLWVVLTEELSRAWRGGVLYALLAFFYLVIGVLFVSSLFQASLEPQMESPLKVFWEMQWLPNLIWVPLLTMRLITQERKAGLLEAVLATPTTPASLVGGKFLAVYIQYVLGWLAVAVFGFLLKYVGLNSAELAYIFDKGAVWGGALFCLFSGAFFVAMGLLMSSLTRNAFVAGALTVALMLLYMVMPMVLGQMSLPVAQWDLLKPFFHFQNLSRFAGGEVDLATLAAYLLGSLIMLVAAMFAVERSAD